MYVLEYCDDPEKGRLFNGERQFDDNFCDEYEEYLIALDRFMYLLDMFQIIKSCAADLAELPAGEEFPFWQVNKALINYLNAVYSYKEYINSYDPPLKTITDGYYYNRKWYRFVCDYRNRVIHQSTIIKDRSTKSGDVFINLDEIISIQSEIIQELEKKKATLTQKREIEKIQNQINNAKRFIRELETFIPEAAVVNNNSRFYSFKNIVKNTQEELEFMNDEILLHALKKSVLPVLEKLLNLSHYQDDKYMYTFIVNKQEKNCYEPLFSLEDFYKYLLCSLGKSNSVCREVYEFLKKKKYLFFYEGMCTIEQFVNSNG